MVHRERGPSQTQKYLLNASRASAPKTATRSPSQEPHAQPSLHRPLPHWAALQEPFRSHLHRNELCSPRMSIAACLSFAPFWKPSYVVRPRNEKERDLNDRRPGRWVQKPSANMSVPRIWRGWCPSWTHSPTSDVPKTGQSVRHRLTES